MAGSFVAMKSPKKASPKRRSVRDPKITREELSHIIERLKKIESYLPSQSGTFPVTHYSKELCRKAFEIILWTHGYCASVYRIGRELNISYYMAKRIIHALEEHGYISGDGPRSVLKRRWRGI